MSLAQSVHRCLRLSVSPCLPKGKRSLIDPSRTFEVIQEELNLWRRSYLSALRCWRWS
jgi:hypothetical protein